MSTNDCRPIHIYRIPVCQKRIINQDNHIAMPYARSPSPGPIVRISGRRHSTPPVSSTVRLVGVNSSQSNKYIKHYYPPIRPTRIVKEQNDSVKSPSRPVTLVKQERVLRLPTTSTNIHSNTDIILPIAKKNRSSFVETPSPVASNSRGILPKQQWKKRERGISLDLESDIYVSNAKSLQDNTPKSKSMQCCKWYRGKFFCRISHCNLCHWYYHCPFCCWIICITLGLAFLIGIFVLLGFLLR